MSDSAHSDEGIICCRCDRRVKPVSTDPADLSSFYPLAEISERTDEFGRVVREQFSYAELADGFVCYECVTSEEHIDLASRYIELVRREVQRRQVVGIDPVSAEGSFITYAQVLQERLDRLTTEDGD